ncbi:hypothetical protein BH09PSE2_BH09PSE2_24530 [soil metagenome]
MHHSYQGSAAYTFDLMEPRRPQVDRAVLGLVLSQTLSAMDFTVRTDGAVRLSPQLARAVVTACSRTA